MSHWDISVIPLSFEKYLSIHVRFPHVSGETKLYSLVFIDSYQFLTSSLAKLVDICPNLPYTRSIEGVSDSVKLGKGIFPYGYLTSAQVLSETTCLPPKEAFYDVLSDSHISEDDYQRAQTSWLEFQCSTLSDYMMCYLRLDVHQLADVFQHFRHLSLQQDGLDPVHYFSTPALSWDAAFKRCGVEIDLLMEEEQYTFFERGRRGGMTFVNKHYLRRNSPDDDDYDNTKPHAELLYIGKCVCVCVCV
jgi:hypothetical protein